MSDQKSNTLSEKEDAIQVSSIDSGKKRKGGQPGNKNAAKPRSVSPLKRKKMKSLRKRGAPLGNTNALTYGFYTRRLSPQSLDGLDQTGVNSLRDEIEVMRVFSRKVAEIGADVKDLQEAKSLLNTLSNSTSAINRLVRTHTHIPNPELDPAAILRQALFDLEEEWPEFKKACEKFPIYMPPPGDPSYNTLKKLEQERLERERLKQMNQNNKNGDLH